MPNQHLSSIRKLMGRGRVNNVKMNARISFHGDRQIECSILTCFEKPKAVITLKELFRKESDLHAAAYGALDAIRFTGAVFN